MVTHVHGAVGVGDESDGYAEAWYLPVANDIPSGYAQVGTWYDFFKAKAARSFGATWGPGYAVFQYPNHNRASTIWYHDHTLGMTRLNVYAGPAGFYIIRGGPAGDQAVLDSRTSKPAVLPGPAPADGDAFPPTKTYYEVPVAIQDRAFNTDGSLFYPDSREFFDDATPEEARVHPRFRSPAHLEPGVLRQHDHGQRQHVALPPGGETQVPLALPQWLPVPLLDPGLQGHPRSGCMADRQRGRIPHGAGEASPSSAIAS